MIFRETYFRDLSARLQHNPTVVILGPRQVGKTTLARMLLSDINSEYYDLESPNTLNAIKLDLESFLSSKKDVLLILDEVQMLPEIFTTLRSVIDKDRKNSKFLLLGSANPSLITGVSESLAGRVSYMYLVPFTLSEIGYENMEKHWFRGGFPLAFLAPDDTSSNQWIRDYIRSYIERDLSIFFRKNFNSSFLGRLWTMLAHLNGQLLNSSDLGRSLGVSPNTINDYLDILEGAFLIRRLQPWFTNISKRLIKSPKLYLTDTGILHNLLNINSFSELLFHPIIGASWENYVIQQIYSQIKDKVELYFYRTHNGSEVDLVLVKGITPIASIEIKNSNSPSISRGFYIAIDDIKTKYNYIITRNSSKFQLKGITICSLSHFLRDELKNII
jgi:uncharacterized protein